MGEGVAIGRGGVNGNYDLEQRCSDAEVVNQQQHFHPTRTVNSSGMSQGEVCKQNKRASREARHVERYEVHDQRKGKLRGKVIWWGCARRIPHQSAVLIDQSDR